MTAGKTKLCLRDANLDSMEFIVEREWWMRYACWILEAADSCTSKGIEGSERLRLIVGSVGGEERGGWDWDWGVERALGGDTERTGIECRCVDCKNITNKDGFRKQVRLILTHIIASLSCPDSFFLLPLLCSQSLLLLLPPLRFESLSLEGTGSETMS